MKTHSSTRKLLGKALKFSTVLAMTAATLSALPAISASAAKYSLIIGGEDVTDRNKNDVLENGVFTYDSVENTLTIKSADLYYFGYFLNTGGGTWLQLPIRTEQGGTCVI